jgi:hypothetical protein
MTDATEEQARVVESSESFASLTALLWTERDAVEHVLFKLVQEHLVLSAPALRWLPRVDDELAAAVRAMQDCARERTRAVAQLADAFELSAPYRMTQLIAVAPEPWPAVLNDHRTALRVLLRDLTSTAAATRRKLRESARAVRECLEELRAERGTGFDQFRAVDRELSVTAVDATHTSALQTASALVDRGLVNFLS